MPPDDTHYASMEDAAQRGTLTVFYGAGANYAQCPDEDKRKYSENANFLPTGAELALYLADKYQFPDYLPYNEYFNSRSDPLHAAICGTCLLEKKAAALMHSARIPDLAKVSQYARTAGKGNLTLDLYGLFSKVDFPCTNLHQQLARLPSLARSNRLPVFITTNYDTMLERALAAVGEPFDVLFYRAPGPGTPVWLYHWKNAHEQYREMDPVPVSRGYAVPVTDLATYQALPIGDGRPLPPPQCEPAARARTILVKIHGTVAPDGYVKSSFVISQSDYISFLRLVPALKPLPTPLLELMQESHFLFLGYGLGDWNILALCQNLWNARTVEEWQNWAIQFRTSEQDRRRWASESAGKVTVFDLDLEEYADELIKRLK